MITEEGFFKGFEEMITEEMHVGFEEGVFKGRWDGEVVVTAEEGFFNKGKGFEDGLEEDSREVEI